MTIKRRINGKTVKIKLTRKEIRLAGEENDMEYRSEDVLSKLREMADLGDIPLSEEQLEIIPADVMKEFTLDAAVDVERVLSKNDSYFDAFRCSVETVLTEKIDWKTTLPKLLGTVETVKEGT